LDRRATRALQQVVATCRIAVHKIRGTAFEGIARKNAVSGAKRNVTVDYTCSQVAARNCIERECTVLRIHVPKYAVEPPAVVPVVELVFPLKVQFLRPSTASNASNPPAY